MIRVLILTIIANCFFGDISFCQSGNSLLLKDYRLVSIYKSPLANISGTAYPVKDMHGHHFAVIPEDIDNWVKTMDKTGIQKTMVLTYNTGKAFDRIVEILNP